MRKFRQQSINTETKKIALIIGLIVLSIFIGIVDRVESSSIPTGSVIPKSSVMVIPVEGMITSMGSQWEGSIKNS